MKKSEALKKTAARIIENPHEYSWNRTSQCNCGILAQVVLGVSRDELQNKYIPSYASTWANMIGVTADLLRHNFIKSDKPCATACHTTNMDTLEMFEALRSAGFSMEEMMELERLTNEKYNGKPEEIHHADKWEVTYYLLRWAQDLEKQGL